MNLHAEISLEVPFHDVDSMGIVWHGHYLKYLEIARTALLRLAELDLDTMAATGCGWPIVTCELKYLRPLTYGQRVRVTATLMEYENRLKIAYAIFDAASGEKLTKAATVQLAVNLRTGELAEGTPAPMVEAIARASRA